MLRLVGIIVICLSTFVGPAVHASAMMSRAPAPAVTIDLHTGLDCGETAPIAVATQFDCAPAVHDKAAGQRCQIGIAPPNNQPFFAGADVGPAGGCGDLQMLPGIDPAPPHRPPRSAFAANFA